MDVRRWEIGICGTFDVANYGDLLFPLIAEFELTQRLGPINLHRFSYRTRSAAYWPYNVTSVSALPEMIHGLDGILIGGGFLIRFDKQVAPSYAPTTSGIHHPTGYWLTPALLALQHNVPLVWNAPGMHSNDIPLWASPLVETALTFSRYIAVRDELSRSTLQALTSATVDIVPDTAFGLQRLLNLDGPPSAEFTRLSEAYGLHGPYIVVHSALELEEFVGFLESRQEQFRNFTYLALPIGPAFGEHPGIFNTARPNFIRMAEWPSPLGIAELIGRSEAVVGHSLHLIITALASGVPVFARHNLTAGKYSALQQFETIFEMPPDGKPDPDWFLERIGRKPISASASAACETLKGHWDRIAFEFQGGKGAPTAPEINRFWQSLPGLLEDGAFAGQYRSAVQSSSQAVALAASVGGGTAKVPEPLRDTPPEADAWDGRFETLLQRLGETREEAFALKGETAELSAKAAALQTECEMLRAEAAARLTENAVLRAKAAASEACVTEIKASMSWKLTSPARFAGRLFANPLRMRKQGPTTMINLDQIRRHRLEKDPYQWAALNKMFSSKDAETLVATYPRDHFKLVAASGERSYQYEARSLIGMGADTISHPDELSDAWRTLANDLLSPEYRAAMTKLTGLDLAKLPMEVNVFHYGPGGWLDAHRDLPEKLITQVFYFNRSWKREDGGCLGILRSANPADLVTEILPVVGNSSVLIRSENSWHVVSRVVDGSASSRRSMTVTFYRPGSVSTMWPPGDDMPLHTYDAPDSFGAR